MSSIYPNHQMTVLNLIPTKQRGGIPFKKVDNPGGCIIFYYRYIFESVAQGGQYKFNCIPAGYQPVNPNDENAEIITHGGWVFLPRAEEGGRRGWCEGEDFQRGSSSTWVDV